MTTGFQIGRLNVCLNVTREMFAMASNIWEIV